MILPDGASEADEAFLVDWLGDNHEMGTDDVIVEAFVAGVSWIDADGHHGFHEFALGPALEVVGLAHLVARNLTDERAELA